MPGIDGFNSAPASDNLQSTAGSQGAPLGKHTARKSDEQPAFGRARSSLDETSRSPPAATPTNQPLVATHSHQANRLQRPSVHEPAPPPPSAPAPPPPPPSTPAPPPPHLNEQDLEEIRDHPLMKKAFRFARDRKQLFRQISAETLPRASQRNWRTYIDSADADAKLHFLMRLRGKPKSWPQGLDWKSVQQSARRHAILTLLATGNQEAAAKARITYIRAHIRGHSGAPLSRERVNKLVDDTELTDFHKTQIAKGDPRWVYDTQRSIPEPNTYYPVTYHGNQSNNTQFVPITSIVTSETTKFSPSLTQAIQNKGFNLEEPLVVEIKGTNDDGTTRYKLLDGHHRYASLQYLNQSEAPITITTREKYYSNYFSD